MKARAGGVVAGRSSGGGGAPLEASSGGGSSSMGRLGGKAVSGAGRNRGVVASQGAGWELATVSQSWAVLAAAMWLAVATRACSTVLCKCAEELVATPTTCSAVATSAD